MPNYVEQWKDYDIVEVRGEMVVNHDVFEQLSSYLKTHLSCVTSLIRDSATDNEIKLLDCVCYKCIISDDKVDDIKTFKGLYDEMDHLDACGFKTPKRVMVRDVDCYNFDDKVEQIIGYFENLYDNGELEYDCDGIVVAVNDLDRFYSLGADGNAWLGNFALKMGRIWESNKYSSKIVAIQWEYGKKYITPKAIVEPVITITGSTVTTVPLYNVGVMEKLGLYPGADVYFSYGGETGVTLVTPDGDSISGLA